jgi:hypothetical protein
VRHGDEEARVASVIRRCREEGVESTPETIAQIMVEEDGQAAGDGRIRPKPSTYADYHKAATWVLVLLDEGDELRSEGARSQAV